MDIENIRYDFPSLQFKLVTLHMFPEKRYRDIHLHAALEIICVQKGCVECRVHNEQILLHENDAILINPNFHHRIHALEPSIVSYMQMDISKYSIQDFSRISYRFNEFITHRFTCSFSRIPQGSELYQLFTQIKEEAIEQQDGFQLYLKGYIHLIAAYITRHFITLPSIPEKLLNDIMPVVTYIEEHYLSKIYLDAIAQSTGMEKYRICKRFKDVTGRTIVDYINFIRLQKALELLTAGDKNISDAAFSSGFSSVQYFNRVFKNHYACTPSQYLKSI